MAKKTPQCNAFKLDAINRIPTIFNFQLSNSTPLPLSIIFKKKKTFLLYFNNYLFLQKGKTVS